ncbi:RNA methyltransferase [Prosthecochloris sp. GSB1]|uniref:RNA methyltransferase n=1 Tax=Prosthecochloris sp. GSB1 TaxID=281093 RepID=UPI000B8D0AF7|nr:RNA methyltransferase [Prosthecochloris sp. GSB1]ASQ90287.1 RNA methyltransferase [Prosthecochloris sp. GSB1]
MGLRKLQGDEMGRLGVEEYARAGKHPVTLLLHNIRSMYNVGSIFRSADGAGIEKIILTGYTATPPRKEIDKTALGAQDSVEWEYRRHPAEVLVSLKAAGITVCGLEIAENSRKYTDIGPADFPLCLVLGNEVDGIDDDILALCDHAIEIPQYGTKHSLNVSVAAGIALFELVRAFREFQPATG